MLGVAVPANGGEDRSQGQPMTKAEYEMSGPEERKGALWYRVRSPYQAGETLVRFLVPRKLEPPAKRRVLFVLPVEPGTESRYGSGLAAVQALDVHNRYGLVVVAPTFSDWPWYADHPTDKGIRQESYMLKVVVPLVTRLYPHETRWRGLLGFSKSGWGAFSLLLRHPEAFGAAVAWDAPLMMAKPRFGMDRIVGTLETFEAYRVPALLAKHAEAVRDTKRLAHFGYGNFREHHQQAHALMKRLGIPHGYADGPRRKHHWDGGWVEDAVRLADGLLR